MLFEKVVAIIGEVNYRLLAVLLFNLIHIRGVIIYYRNDVHLHHHKMALLTQSLTL
jgi:hypothetical protein